MATVLTIPENAKVVEKPTAFYWFDGNKWVYFIGKKSHPIEVAEAQEFLQDWQEMAGNKPFCLIADVTNVTPAPKVIREYAAIIFPEQIVAIAILSASPMGRMVGHLFLQFKPMPYPAKVFGNEIDAKKWLSQYL